MSKKIHDRLEFLRNLLNDTSGKYYEDTDAIQLLNDFYIMTEVIVPGLLVIEKIMDHPEFIDVFTSKDNEQAKKNLRIHIKLISETTKTLGGMNAAIENYFSKIAKEEKEIEKEIEKETFH